MDEFQKNENANIDYCSSVITRVLNGSPLLRDERTAFFCMQIIREMQESRRYTRHSFVFLEFVDKCLQLMPDDNLSDDTKASLARAR